MGVQIMIWRGFVIGMVLMGGSCILVLKTTYINIMPLYFLHSNILMVQLVVAKSGTSSHQKFQDPLHE